MLPLTRLPISNNLECGEGAGAEESKEEIVREIPEEEFVRLTTKMFPKWAKDDTKIARFMKNLDPIKIYTKTEMKELCEQTGIKDMSHLTTIKYNNSAGWGKIIRKNMDNTYQLYPELIKSYINF